MDKNKEMNIAAFEEVLMLYGEAERDLVFAYRNRKPTDKIKAKIEEKKKTLVDAYRSAVYG